MSTCVHDSLSPKGAKSQQGSAHIALLSSLGYNNESNCVLLTCTHHPAVIASLSSSVSASAALHAKLPPTPNHNTLLHII